LQATPRLVILAAAVLAVCDGARAEWAGTVEGNLFYTNDVSLFSASRRLSLREDPTQPVVDRTRQGEDMVMEPVVEVRRVSTSRLGATEISFKTQGYVYAQNPLFNHGTYRLRLTQDLSPSMLLRLHYYYAPNLFLGPNREHRTGTGSTDEERVTTHFWSAHLEQRVGESLNLRLLGRYGLRLYNEAFAERDTRFWTIGPHLEWRLSPRLDMTVGYHYERGLADGRNQPQFNDDVSYINHYVSWEATFRLTQRTSFVVGFDYERNDFTSELADDDRRGAREDVYQGDVKLRHAVSNAMALTLGFQRSQRNATLERRAISDINVWVGGDYRF